MQCSPCQTENKPGRKFCSACGQAFPLTCSQCGLPTTQTIGSVVGAVCPSPFKPSRLSVFSRQFSVVRPQHLTPSTQTEAEACFLKAIEISRKQQAKSLKLRASVSLARLWQSQGKLTEAHQMFLEVYNRFTERLDTKDLQEAKALIEELSH